MKEQQNLTEQGDDPVEQADLNKGEEAVSNVDEQRDAHSEILNDGPVTKKMKLSDSDQHGADVNDRQEDAFDAKDDHDSDHNKDNDEQVNENHKSKNRHRKISVKNKRAANLINTPLKSVRSLRICTKIEWKRLRNKYLNEQHQQRKLLKQQFKSNKQVPPTQPMKKIVQNPRKINFYNANKEDGKEVTTNKIQSIKTPLFTFAAGVIVKIFFDEPCADIADFKRDLRTQPYVKYVDIEESQAAAVVRVDSSRSAPTLIKHCAPHRCQILTGDNESDYWRKMEVDWKNKVSKNVKVATKRGRDKLAKVVATHVRFDE